MNTNTEIHTDDTDTTTENTTKTSRKHHPIRWAIAVLALAIVGLGGLQITENRASAAAGNTYITSCWSDQWGAVSGATISSQYYNMGNPKTWATAKTNANGCATVRTPTNSKVRLEIRQQIGQCPSWYCWVTSGSTTWFSTVGTKAGWTYNVGRLRVNTLLIDSGYQATQSVLNGMR